MPTDRRTVLSAAGLGLLAFQVGGATALLSARDARAQAVPLRVLTPSEALTLEILGDTLVPGAAAAGLTHYLDQQFSANPIDSLLMIRYLDVPPPYYNFYKPALAAVNSAARALHHKAVEALSPAEREILIETMQKGNPPDWQGPAAPFFYFVLRADAIDVVYGTPEGFAKLGIPYMPHIMPSRKW